MQKSAEADTVASVLPTVAGRRDSDFRRAREVLFTDAASIIPEVSKPKPDLLYGTPASQINLRVRQVLDRHIRSCSFWSSTCAQLYQ